MTVWVVVRASSRFYAGFRENGRSSLHSHRLTIGIGRLPHPAYFGQMSPLAPCAYSTGIVANVALRVQSFDR